MLTKTNNIAAYILAIESIEERFTDAKNLAVSLKPLEVFQEISIVPAIFWKAPQTIVEFLTRFPEYTFTQKFLLKGKIGQVATALSHISIWRRLIESEHNGALIFEDDIYVSDVPQFVKTMDALKKNQDVDWVRVHLLRGYLDMALKKTNDSFFIDDTLPFGFAAYYVSKSGAKKMLEHCHNMNAPIDWLPPLMKKRGDLSTKALLDNIVEHHEFNGGAHELAKRHKIELRSGRPQKSPSSIWTSPPVSANIQLYSFLLDQTKTWVSKNTSAKELKDSRRPTKPQGGSNRLSAAVICEQKDHWMFSPIVSETDLLQPAARDFNVNELRQNVITVLTAVFDKQSVQRSREDVLSNRCLLKKTRVTPSSGHLAGFHRFPALEPLHTMLTCHPSINRFLEVVLDREKVRSIGLSDITINRSQTWHKDLLRGKFRHYLDGVLNWDIDGGGVYKILFYLQDSTSLKYIKGSHLTAVSLENDKQLEPTDDTLVSSITVSAGDIVIMDIRCSHKGTDESFYADGQYDANPNILISTMLGGVNRQLTTAMEIGNFHRLQEWMVRFP